MYLRVAGVFVVFGLRLCLAVISAEAHQLYPHPDRHPAIQYIDGQLVIGRFVPGRPMGLQDVHEQDTPAVTLHRAEAPAVTKNVLSEPVYYPIPTADSGSFVWILGSRAPPPGMPG
jgi:hypothetical protein